MVMVIQNWMVTVTVTTGELVWYRRSIYWVWIVYMMRYDTML